jgi:hypothetical protein
MGNTDREKARYFITECFESEDLLGTRSEPFSSDDMEEYGLGLLEWKEKQMIDKAVNWITLNAETYGGFNVGKLNEMVLAMKKAMADD